MIRQVFVCPKCRKVSHNPNDAKNRYCGACKDFVAVFADWSMRGFTVYEHPNDFPDFYVVREWRNGLERPVVTQALPETFLADTLEEARRAIPPGMFRLGPDVEDDSKIVEVWI